jgi:hypothetical protein
LRRFVPCAWRGAASVRVTARVSTMSRPAAREPF